MVSHFLSAHPSNWQLAPKQVGEALRLTKSNIKTSQILLQLRKSESGTLAVNCTIKTAINKMWVEELLGKTPIEALLGFLKESNCLWDLAVKNSGSIKKLFFVYPGSIHLS